jgi:hypothetical protein
MSSAIWPTVAVVLLAACAGSPAARTAPEAVAKTPTAVATAADATAPIQGPPADLREVAQHAGYQPRTVNGHVVFCHDEIPLGTRFPHSVCLTEAQLRARLQANEEVKESMRRPVSLDPAK